MSSGIAGSSTKRKGTPSFEDPATKRRKKLDSVNDQLVAAAEALKRMLPMVAEVPDVNTHHVNSLGVILDFIITGEPRSAEERDFLSSPIECPTDWQGVMPGRKNIFKKSISVANVKLADVVKYYQPLLQMDNSPPNPSDYAKRSVWTEWQEKEGAILCLRPSVKQGLSLSILDDVFREFRIQAKGPLPQTRDGAVANCAALKLCQEMGDTFTKEEARRKTFELCINDLFRTTEWRNQHAIRAPSELHGALADSCFILNDVICIIREDKIELGEGNDCYIQVARDFQIYISSLLEKNDPLIKRGAPTFLLCILGPLLIFAGGFYDGKSTLVEPLIEPSLMLPDHLHVRQNALACKLFALKQAVNGLARATPSEGTLVPGVPRVYPTFSPFPSAINQQSLTIPRGEEQSLNFVRCLQPPDPHLFLANVASFGTCLVKLINPGDSYGTNVHQLLASYGLAPLLHGHKCLSGAPTAYIMEYLAPPSTNPPSGGWVTLFEMSKSKSSKIIPTYKNSIWSALETILRMMEKESIVHGDLRSNNIMLEVDADGFPTSSTVESGLCVKVVDFDWGGKSGEVRYPWRRNESISWPSGAGEPIIVGHDRQLVEQWWPKFISELELA